MSGSDILDRIVAVKHEEIAAGRAAMCVASRPRCAARSTRAGPV